MTLDGEFVLETHRGWDFAALMTRLHPAESRVRRLSVEIPARFSAFDLIWRAGRDLRSLPFERRRRELEAALADLPTGIELISVIASGRRRIDGQSARPSVTQILHRVGFHNPSHFTTTFRRNMG